MNNLITGLLTSGEATIGMMILFVIILFLVLIGMYVYMSWALMSIANKTKTGPAWLAWIPIGNMVLIAKIVQMHWWPILLLIPAIISFFVGATLLLAQSIVLGTILVGLYWALMLVFGVFSTIWSWKMFKAVNRPGWWSLVGVIPSTIYIILSLFGNDLLTIVGAIISLFGTIAYLVFMGIAAWSDAPTKVVKTVKKTRKKK